MEDKQVNRPERVLIAVMVEPDKPDPLTILHRIKSTLEGVDGVSDVDIQQVGNVPISERTFQKDLELLINARSIESGSHTPDFVLASYLKSCLDTWDLHTRERDRWYGNRSALGPGNDHPAVNASEKSLLRPDTPEIDQRPATAWHPPQLKSLDLPFGLLGAVNQVYLFHEKFGLPWHTDTPMWPGPQRSKLRWRLTQDEFEELRSAWASLENFLAVAGIKDQVATPGDFTETETTEFVAEFKERLAAVAREMVDEIYTIIGTAGEFGIDLAAAWDVVHQSNMAKVGGGQDAQGKVLKPEGWQEPDVEGAIFK